MNVAEMKKILKQWANSINTCREFTQEIENLNFIIKDTRNLIGHGYSEKPKNREFTKIVEQAVEKNIDTYEKRINQLSDEIAATLSKKMYIDSLVITLPKLEQDIIKYRYCKDYTWRYIEVRTGLSASYLQKLHKKSLTKLINYME